MKSSKKVKKIIKAWAVCSTPEDEGFDIWQSFSKPDDSFHYLISSSRDEAKKIAKLRINGYRICPVEIHIPQ